MATADGRAVARVLLVRHGESTWNSDLRWQGQADPPLSEVGRRQAHAVGALPAIATVWSSDLRRARGTAEVLAGTGKTVRLDARLRERHVGSWTGLTRDEIERRYPGWLADGRRPAGWEDDEIVRARAWPALRAAAAAAGSGRAIVVSHGGLIRAVVAALGATPWPVPHLGGVWLVGDGERLDLGERVALLPRVEQPVDLTGGTAE
jgi:probable phosphoglycerate mutase